MEGAGKLEGEDGSREKSNSLICKSANYQSLAFQAACSGPSLCAFVLLLRNARSVSLSFLVESRNLFSGTIVEVDSSSNTAGSVFVGVVVLLAVVTVDGHSIESRWGEM